jgi:hypothetical protein
MIVHNQFFKSISTLWGIEQIEAKVKKTSGNIKQISIVIFNQFKNYLLVKVLNWHIHN